MGIYGLCRTAEEYDIFVILVGFLNIVFEGYMALRG